MENAILGSALLFTTTVMPVNPMVIGQPSFLTSSPVVVNQSVASETLDLKTRSPFPSVNEGFGDNILLSLHYLNGEKFSAGQVNWEEIRKPLKVSFMLGPDQVFAFHDLVLPQYQNPAVTLNSNFSMKDGYKFVAGLPGSGVCHLATLMTWVAKEAGLEVTALASHDFAPVKGIDRKYGTAIMSNSATQNLYIKNNSGVPLVFEFMASEDSVVFSILSPSVLH
jgi:hypothetical protein